MYIIKVLPADTWIIHELISISIDYTDHDILLSVKPSSALIHNNHN